MRGTIIQLILFGRFLYDRCTKDRPPNWQNFDFRRLQRMMQQHKSSVTFDVMLKFDTLIRSTSQWLQPDSYVSLASKKLSDRSMHLTMGRLFTNETSDIPHSASSYINDNSSANSTYDYASFLRIDPDDGRRDVQRLDELITQQYN